MEETKKNENSFLISLTITLGTIIVGLISYIVYTENFKADFKVCEYNGWAYSHGESFESSDGCNICSCNDGAVACTLRACEEQAN